ncbi:F-box protein [Aspergillus undulatus]|uniref:F-box protein n=1 Tax=Aspergillus undulatus TaxID=1810928 RepID=UPI003CCCD074
MASYPPLARQASINVATDENFPAGTEALAFHCYEWTADPVFPFHRACFEILEKVIAGKKNNLAVVDKDFLYLALFELASSTQLAVDYGPINGAGLYWTSIAGEEFSVAHPLDSQRLQRFLQVHLSMIISGFRTAALNAKLETELQSPELRWKKETDSFAKLPYDILDMILLYLPTKSINALRKASRSFYLATRHPSFWKGLMRRRMPWAWELEESLKEYDKSAVNYECLFSWLSLELSTPYGICSYSEGLPTGNASGKPASKSRRYISSMLACYLPISPTNS